MWTPKLLPEQASTKYCNCKKETGTLKSPTVKKESRSISRARTDILNKDNNKTKTKSRKSRVMREKERREGRSRERERLCVVYAARHYCARPHNLTITNASPSRPIRIHMMLLL